ncbi:protein OSB2, chloroplastic-like isoform X2 [Magnolia sinica]|uniref:protein OSB2, chloroplastic-like isoform X2 n=1 Tax=Magnolia sinica TaxID=86752 RepID=UPI002658224D|nr:protein OSB2, chloroplastic-like isoform X2 [Magnolia sinica]
MNLSGKIAASLSQSNGKRFLLLRSVLLQSSSISTQPAASAPAAKTGWTKTPKPKSKNPEPAPDPTVVRDYAVPSVAPPQQPFNWSRPAEVPWQPKVANSVHLMGSVGIPVQLDISPDGRYWAVSVLTKEKMKEFPQLWIPIIFEGDLAHVAACHLKENDLIYITGQLSGDPPPFAIEQGRTSIQVMVQSLSFVQKTYPNKRTQAPYEENGQASDDLAKLQFTRDTRKTVQSVGSPWRDLLANPEQWWDHRLDKLNGLVSPKHPDFKHKEKNLPIWIDRAPEQVLSGLEGLKFDVKKGEKVKHGSPIKRTVGEPSSKPCLESTDASWKDLVENPKNWWDNRSCKLNPKAPDFKHKVTGEGLWINRTPAWALSKLPPSKPKSTVNINMKDTLLS